MSLEEVVVILLLAAVLAAGGFGLYWMIRRGVRAGIKDADLRRAAERQVPPQS